jgi:hypothetical protein
MLNDLRVRERYTSRNNGERRRPPGKTRYRHFLGVKWSQVQILAARQEFMQVEAVLERSGAASFSSE